MYYIGLFYQNWRETRDPIILLSLTVIRIVTLYDKNDMHNSIIEKENSFGRISHGISLL